jgi:hypothetical protein
MTSNQQAADWAIKCGSRPDSRGPQRKWLAIEPGTSETLVTFECGHTGHFNPIYDYKLDPTHRCHDCGRETLALYDAVLKPFGLANPFKCGFCGEVYEYGDPNHSHN